MKVLLISQCQTVHTVLFTLECLNLGRATGEQTTYRNGHTQVRRYPSFGMHFVLTQQRGIFELLRIDLTPQSLRACRRANTRGAKKIFSFSLQPIHSSSLFLHNPHPSFSQPITGASPLRQCNIQQNWIHPLFVVN